MRNRRLADNSGIEDGGQDSFLDIVANLVGILVILIMVIGVRAVRLAERRGHSPAVHSGFFRSVATRTAGVSRTMR